MARAIWSGSITFGLVNVPVKMYTAVRDRGVHFHMLSDDGTCRLRRRLVCPETGKEYEYDQTTRGFEIAPDQYVIVSNEELSTLKPEASRTIEITDFVDLAEIDPLYYNRPYYLAPDERGVKAYFLLHEAMSRAGKVGIASFVMRQKQYLAALRPMERALCLEVMNYADEIAPLEEIPGIEYAGQADKRELQVAERLIKALSGTFEPEKYRDEYREQLLEMIEKKAAGEEVVIQPPREEPARIADLMQALEASLAQVGRDAGRPRKKSSASTAARPGEIGRGRKAKPGNAPRRAETGTKRKTGTRASGGTTRSRARKK